MMKTCLCLMSTVLILGSTAPAQTANSSEDAAPEKKKRIVLVNVGGVDPSMFDRIVSHVEDVFHTEPLLLPPQEAVGSDAFDDEVEPLEGLKTEETYCLVALIMAGENNPKYGAVYPEQRVGFVNARAMKPEGGDEEQYGRRLDKETVRAIAHLMGFPPAPIIQCATFAYTDDEGLDAKGRNLCPPYYLKMLKIAEEANLEGYPRPPFGAPQQP